MAVKVVFCYNVRMRQISLFLCATVLALNSLAAFSPAGTVTFTDLRTIAAHVESLARGKSDLLLSQTLPQTIRNQGAARLFGPMRRGMPGVAVCYVDAALLAKLTASRSTKESDYDRAKRWSVLYPASIDRANFLKRHPNAVKEKNGAFRIPPGQHSRRTLWVAWSADGQWASLAPASSMAVHVHTAAAVALRRPLNNGELAFVRMDAAGARAVFQSDSCAGASISVRMTQAGLELWGTVRAAGVRLPLPPGATSFKHVPPNAPFFGVTSSPDDVRSTDVFSFAGPEVSAFVKKSLAFVKAQGYSTYFLNGSPSSLPPPKARLAAILPEAASRQAVNVMFCSPTTVLRLYLPRVAATMMPLQSAKMQMGVRLLRRVRGDGMGLASWREGHDDRFLVRISRDELYGTAGLWSMLFD